jgi:hypothetical protein
MRPDEGAAAEALPPPRLIGVIETRPALRVAIALVLLLFPWPRVGRVYSAVFAVYANGVVHGLPLGTDGASPRISFPTEAQRRDPGVDDWTVMLSVVGPAANEGQAMPLGVRILGYTPFAILVALLVGTPTAGRRKLKMAALGMAILAARLAIGIAIPVARVFGQLGGQTTAGVAAQAAWETLIDQPALSYVTPLLAWGVSFLATSPGKFPQVTGKRKRRRKTG